MVVRKREKERKRWCARTLDPQREEEDEERLVREREMFLESSFRREEEKSKEGRRRTLSVPNSRSIPFGT